MERCTVYFDTGFYRDLAALPEAEAGPVLASLDELGVRTVLSPVVLEELLQDGREPALDRRLADALLFLREPSLRLAPDLSWAMLKLGPAERRALVALHRRTGPVQALGDALALLPRAEGTAAERKKLQAQLDRRIAQLGFDALQGFGDARVDWLLEAAGLLLKGAGKDLGARAPGGLKLRDLRRQAELVRHAAEIDLYQADLAELGALARQGPEHPLIAAGLLPRCFAVEPGQPLEALAEVRRRG
ncbi:MAG TPA: hypothetical protein PK668_10650 [Myxococcota bacterium]|nr:hypothetical protein [Myxococcota bacterium]HRY93378.1 hypothetical protein [Myxococcota bacterium]HSA23042.1 hypothetical protein [Myxococcota bacterium]